MNNMDISSIVLSKSGSVLPINMGFSGLDFGNGKYQQPYASLQNAWPTQTGVTYAEYDGGFTQINWDLRRNHQTFDDDHGAIDIRITFDAPLPTNTRLTVYTIDVNHFYVLDSNGNFIPKLDKLTA
jgi:hypothetical protein